MLMLISCGSSSVGISQRMIKSRSKMSIPSAFLAPTLLLSSHVLGHTRWRRACHLSKRGPLVHPVICSNKLPGDVESRAKPPLFEVRNVTYRVPRHYDLWLFDEMDFHIDAGEFVVMLGPNGSGKSTAVKIMLGLEKVTEGDFFWKGERVKPDDMVDRCGIVLQNPANYFITKRVIDELTIGRPERTPDDVRRVMTNVGLTDISLMSDPGALSGGQIRRLAVADQMMKDPSPSLFILDEPLSGVDWVGRSDILKFLSELKNNRDLSVLLVSHEPADLLPFADRVVELRQRKIIDIDPEIVSRAIQTRKALKRKRRLQAIEDARLYRLGQQRKTR